MSQVETVEVFQATNSRLRIGIEVEQLRNGFRTGLYWYQRNLLQGMHALHCPHSIRLFLHNANPTELDELKRLFPGFQRNSFAFPGFPYRLRMRFCAANRVDVFQYVTSTTIPISRFRRNAFLCPDLTTVLFPQWHREATCCHWNQLLERMRDSADLILTFSEHTKLEVCSRLSVAPDIVHAVPLAAGDEFRPLPRDHVAKCLQKWGLEPGRYVLSVGALEPRKNHVTLIRAFAHMRRDPTFRDYRLVLAGPRGWLCDEVFNSIAQLRLDDCVAWLGRVDQLPELYCGAAVMVYPSFYEGFGLPPLEAMACGTPVISSNTSSLPEVIADAGILLDPNDEAGFAEAVRNVLSEPQLQTRMKERGISRAAEFSWQLTARRTLQAYEHLCGTA